MAEMVPRKGDIVVLRLGVSSVYPRGTNRYALVITSRRFNQATGLAFVVPISEKRKGQAIEVPIEGKQVQGVALVSSLRSVDWKMGKAELADICPEDALLMVQGMIVAFVTSDE